MPRQAKLRARVPFNRPTREGRRVAAEPLERRVLMSAGDLDATFGAGGLVATNFGELEDGRAVAVMADGRTLLAANVGYGDADSGPRFAVARYNVDGSLDTTFGDRGITRTDVGASSVLNAVAVAPQGKIVVAGTGDLGSRSDIVLLRYDAQGSLDPTFGNGGVVRESAGGNYSAQSLAIRPDGKILVVGSGWSVANPRRVAAVLRFNADGSIDTSFGRGGTDGDGVVTAFASDPGGSAFGAVSVMPDGRIVAVGSDGPRVAVARFTPDGEPDPTFSEDGRTSSALGVSAAAQAVAVDGDGGVIAVATVFPSGPVSPTSDVAVLRYRRNGTLDTAFGGGGSTTVDFHRQGDVPVGVSIIPGGRILVAAQTGVGADIGFGVAALDSHGALDPTFSPGGPEGDGKAFTDFSPIGRNGAVARGAAMTPDGKLVVGGTAAIGDLGLARFIVVPPAGPTYEAEQASVAGAVVSNGHAGYTGTGFVDYQNLSGDAVEFTVAAPTAGWYDLSFRYANGGASDRPVALSVSGQPVAGGVTFAPTGSWTTWRDAVATVQLSAGTNTVRLTANGQSGPNLDSLTLRPSQPTGSGTYQAESAVLSGATGAANQAGYTGSGFADYRHASGDFVEFTVDVPSGGAGALDFRYANGGTTSRAMELRVDGQLLAGGISFAPSGGWTTWKTASRDVNLSAGRHTIRLSAVGSSGPNLDALTVRPATVQSNVAYLSQSRSVEGELVEYFDVVDPDTGEVIRDRESNADSRAAPDFADFDGAVSVRVTPPPGWDSGVASGTQHSRLTPGGIFVSGQLDAHTGTDRGAYYVTSDLDVTFELAQPRAYAMQYSITTDTSANPRRSITLSRVGGATIFEEVPPLTNNTVTGSRSGTLAAGRYRFVLHHAIGADTGSSGPYSVALVLD